jgi:transposase
MNKTTNKYTPEVRERAVRMVLNGEGQHESRWAAIVSISAKMGCAPQTLNEWVKKVEVDIGPIGRFVRRIPLRRNNRRTLVV